MFNNLFNKPKEKTSNPANGLSVILGSESSEPYVYMFVENLDKNEPEKFANMLFSLSNGLYAESLFNTLQELAKENEDINLFVAKVIARLLAINENLSKNIAPTEDINKPLIKPTNFMRKNNE